MQIHKKHNLSDVTFLIPIRLDSIVRLENLLMTIAALCKNFDTHITVLEAAPCNNNIIQSLFKENPVTHLFIEDNDPVFHRTKYLNLMTQKAATPFVSIWDADIIIDENQIIDSLLNLRNQKADIAFPYDGHFYDTTDIIRKHYAMHQDINFFKRNEARMELLYGNQMIGGAIIVNRQNT